MIFTEETTAIASVGEDLIKVKFTESGVHKFSVDQGAANKGEVKAVYKGKYVYHWPVFWTKENVDQHTIKYGNIKVSFTDPVRFVLASKSYIWAIDKNGGIFRINSDGNKLSLGTYNRKEMIGHGTFEDGLWIAFSDGTINIFGDSTETSKIALP
jgi:hypothetical protein